MENNFLDAELRTNIHLGTFHVIISVSSLDQFRCIVASLPISFLLVLEGEEMGLFPAGLLCI